MQRRFDYDAPAEFFLARSRKAGDAVSTFRHGSGGDRFAIEELPAPMLIGVYLQVENERFDGGQIRKLYDGAA